MSTPKTGLQPAEPALSSLLDLLPVGVAQLTEDGRIVRGNLAMCRILGLRPPLNSGSRLADVGWTVGGQGWTADLALLLAQADTAFEADSLPGPGLLLRLWHPNGNELVVRVSASRIVSEDPDVRYLLSVVDVSPENRLNEELRAEREHFRILADNVGEAVVVLHGHDIVWASPSAADVIGHDARELVGRSLADLVTKDVPPPDGSGAGALPPLPEPGESISHRIRLRLGPGARTGAGTVRWFHASVASRRRFGEDPVIYACLRDIEEQVRAEQALAASERVLSQAFDATPDAWAIIAAERGPDGTVEAMRFVRVNPAGFTHLLFTEQEVIGREIGEVFPSESGERLREGLEAALAARVQMPNRASVELNGRRHLFEGFMVPLDDDTLLCAWRDVTELVEAEELLNRAYEETAEMRVTLQTALDATSDGFAVYSLEWDDDGLLTGMRVVHANTAGAESLGLDAEEMIGQELHEFFPQVDASGLWDRVVTAAVTKEPQHHRVHLHDADGAWKAAWDNTIAPVGEERITITWRDVSKEETAIRQLARTRDEAMYSATHDALTDLPNRVLLIQHLQEALRNCRPGERVGIVFVDLNHFKQVNDTYGHAAGDAVLVETASRLTRMVRHGDLAGRLAGDEFILVLTSLAPDWSPEQFFARAAEMLSEPFRAGDVELHPSAALGAVLADPHGGPVDVDELIKLADAEMYRAKAVGRDPSDPEPRRETHLRENPRPAPPRRPPS